MAVDLGSLSVEELQALAYQANAVAQQRITDAAQAELEAAAGRNERINTAVARLTALLGPEGAPAYIPGGEDPPSIRGLLAYPPEIMAENAGIALQMLYQGLEELAVTTRDIAATMAVPNNVVPATQP